MNGIILSLMYPPIEPYETGTLDVGDGHVLYYELCGNPDGIPAVYLHGGPGGGIHPDMRRFFDPALYKIVLFDQRGCGKSTPFAGTENNSIRHLTDDVDKLREHLGIEKWMVCGGSWGSTLSLFYALSYPEKTGGLVLIGISLGDRRDVDWLTEEGGAGEFMPEWFAPYRDLIPPEKRTGGLGAAYCEIMCNGTEEEILEAAKTFSIWDTALLCFDIPYHRIKEVEDDPHDFVPLAKIFFHFVRHEYKDENKTRIMEGVKGLGHIPCHIIHGRHDLICTVRQAYELHKAFPGSELHILHGAGHTAREKANAAKIVEITDRLAGERQ